jgi:thiol:disulfide interchange protein DsbD
MGPRPLVPAIALCLTGAMSVPPPPDVEVAAIPEFASVAPGEVFQIALRLQIPRGYHISWINPGQTGLPTTIAWDVPDGFRIDETRWPFPERHETAGLVSHIYRGVVVAFTRFTVDSSAARATVVLRAELTWGLCGRTCSYQQKTIDVSLAVGTPASGKSAAWKTIVSSLDLLPVSSTDLTVRGLAGGDGVRLDIAGSSLRMPIPETATFFPASSDLAVAVAVQASQHGITLRLPGDCVGAHPRRVEGVLVTERPWLTGSPGRALLIEAVVQDSLQDPKEPTRP